MGDRLDGPAAQRLDRRLRRSPRLEVRQRCPRQLLQARHLRRGRLPPRHCRVKDIQGGIDGAFHPDTKGHMFGYAPAIGSALRTVLGFPYSGPTYTGPMYAGTGAPEVCDSKVRDGNRERNTVAPDTDPTGLNCRPTSPPTSPAGASREARHRPTAARCSRTRSHPAGRPRSSSAPDPPVARATPGPASVRTAPVPCCGSPCGVTRHR